MISYVAHPLCPHAHLCTPTPCYWARAPLAICTSLILHISPAMRIWLEYTILDMQAPLTTPLTCQTPSCYNTTLSKDWVYGPMNALLSCSYPTGCPAYPKSIPRPTELAYYIAATLGCLLCKDTCRSNTECFIIQCTGRMCTLPCCTTLNCGLWHAQAHHHLAERWY